MTNQIGELMWLKTGIIYPLATTFFARAALHVGGVLLIWSFGEKEMYMEGMGMFSFLVLSLPTARKETPCR